MSPFAARPALYLIPGLLCDRHIWENQIAALGDDAEIHVADITGQTSIGAMARQVLDEAPASFALAGHSLGARVALEIYRQAPERVARIALLDTGTHGVRPGEKEKRFELLALAQAQGMAALADRWLPPMLNNEIPPDAAVIAGLKAMVMRMTPEIHANQITALLERPDAEEVLPRLSCPVLVGVGRQDIWSPPSQHEAIVRRVPHARFEIFEDSGHMSPVEAPAAVNAALQNWLRGQRGAPGLA